MARWQESGAVPRIEAVMDDMGDTMQLIYTEVAEGQVDRACFAMYRCFLETMEHVLLAHDEYRIYSEETIRSVSPSLLRKHRTLVDGRD